MTVSDDGAILATGSDDHTDQLTSERTVSQRDDHTVRLWTTTTDACECIGVLVGHDDYVNCVT